MRSVIESINGTIINHKEIGIFISGGFDSAVLGAYVFSHITKNHLDRTVVMYTVPRYDDSVVHAKRVCDWLTERFPEVKFTTITVGSGEGHHSGQVLSGIEEALRTSNRTILLADTKIPDEDVVGESPQRVKSKGPRVIQPFFEYDKTMTIKLAESMDILDEVSKISHTCTESKTLRCGGCWQCNERSWAFTKLSLVDKGTM
jgi:7-cyano-7-deazaguanine synthase in queuosine biosynthesis